MRNTLSKLLLLMLLVQPALAIAVDTLTLGVFPRRSVEVSEKLFQPLADYLGRQLGLKVELLIPPDFPAFWQAVEQERFQLVHYNQYHYLKAHKNHGHRVILMNEEHGSPRLGAAVLVNRDSDVREIGDLRGRKVLFGGGRDAMVSYIMAVDLLRQAGLQDWDYVSGFALNPIAAAKSLHYRQADAACAGDALPKMKNVRWGQGRPPQFRVLAGSEQIAHLPWAVSALVDQRLAMRIRETLIGLKQTRTGRAILKQAHLTGLVAADDADYALPRQIVERVLGEHY